MERSELLQVAQKAMLAGGFINEKQVVAEGFSDELKAAWNKFCHSTPGFRFYAGRVPSPERLSIDCTARLHKMAMDYEAANAKKSAPAPVKDKAPSAPKPEVKDEKVATKVEAEKGVETKEAEKANGEIVANEPVKEAEPVKDEKKAPKKK